MYCKGCGYALGDPEQDLHDPEGLSDVAQELGIQPENEDAHLIVRDGEKGWRYYCADKGQVTSIVPEPPGGGGDKGNREGQGGEPKSVSEQQAQAEPNEVYDVREEKDPVTILAEVVTKPFIGLNEDQVAEVRDWAEDYDGQLPPDMLEDILANMSGVQNQTAALARQKYEVKLNKWVQKQSQGDEGPPIGVTAQPPPGRRSRGGRRGGRTGGSGGSPSPEPAGSGSPPRRGGSDENIPTGDLSTYRRGRRTRRRNDALDTAAQEAAQQVAQEMTGELVREFGRFFSLPAKVIEAKIERDPDWALEKMEQWDINLDAFLEPSEERKEEMREQARGPEVDQDVDAALEQTQGERRERHPPPEEQEVGAEVFDEDEEETPPPERDAPEGLFDEEELPTQRGD